MVEGFVDGVLSYVQVIACDGSPLLTSFAVKNWYILCAETPIFSAMVLNGILDTAAIRSCNTFPVITNIFIG